MEPFAVDSITCMLTCPSPGEENISEDIEQLFELTRIMVLVLTGLVPSIDDGKSGGTCTPMQFQIHHANIFVQSATNLTRKP
jgi:uncharacterized protein with ACT and thioredoxin-like domain